MQTEVWPSASQYWRTSLPDRSALLPTEMKDEIPIPRTPANWTAAMPSAPLCDIRPTPPGGGRLVAKVALRRTPGAALMTPRQLGPTSRMPDSRQTATSCRCHCRPSSPTSANPDDTTTSDLTPAAAHSRATSTTSAAGTAMTAISAGVGSADTDG